MQILWKGQSCFYVTCAPVKQDQARVLMDPFDESVGLKMSPVEADIVTVSHGHADHSNVKAAKGAPFVINTPGEYEVKGVFIQGIPSYHDDAKGKERGANTIFTVTVEGITLCHLGDLGQKELAADQLEKIGSVDILMIPVGGVYTITGEEAAKIIGQIEPKIVIPMHYALPGLTPKLNSVDEFLRTMGKKGLEAQPKLVVKEKDIAAERDEVEIAVLQA
ncbi:MAG: MBL fold metallo-hydrolase [Candidatus Wildermuthbacteria bacterium]|nr:MBL fold metallo-hydrolase [Candidatus Wildermuthbacteria bacterium]